MPPEASRDSSDRASAWVGFTNSIVGPLVMLAAAALAMRRLDDSDTWWHLAAGRWIVENSAVPTHDTLSYTVADHAWVNLQWLYDVLLYVCFSVFGASGLVLAAVFCFTLATAVLYKNLRLSLGPAAAAAFALWAVVVCEERFLIRPEMFSLVLLGVVLSVLLHMRRNDGRGLWALPVLMLIWVNVHSLFIVGLFCVACAVGGAAASLLPFLPSGWREASRLEPACMRRLLFASALTFVVTVLNPYGLQGVRFPLELLTRIDGSNNVFASIGEFNPPFSGYFTTLPITAYQILFFLGIAVVAGSAFVGAWPANSQRRKRSDQISGEAGFDLAAVAWFCALAYVSLLARRNIGLFAIGATPIIGMAFAILRDRLPRDVEKAFRRFTVHASVPVAVAALVLVFSVVTNRYYHWNQSTHAFGLGVFESNFPVYASKFAREAQLPSKLYNDLSAGGYLTWSEPVAGGVFIDGRLEVYDAAFFDEYRQGLGNPNLWGRGAETHGYETAIIFHRWPNRRPIVQALERSPAWTRVYVDEVAVVFVKTAGNADAIARSREIADDWNRRNDERLARRGSAIWQVPTERLVGLQAYATVLGVLGDSPEAIKRLGQGLQLEPEEPVEAELRLQMAYHKAVTGDRDSAKAELARVLEIAPEDQRAKNMLTQLGG